MLAEKIVTALTLGDFSTRVRDWGDIYVVSRSHDFDGQALRAAASRMLE
ncbi:MAG: nucleotidyl transferase AbiEii/AbiGii toxin family protein [Promicromonosporaceae bacterium]|nr:nucleotidyl transferase AbiEii/AbiGii toxin family protein [Promicromonosporaceae bacterium]